MSKANDGVRGSLDIECARVDRAQFKQLDNARTQVIVTVLNQSEVRLAQISAAGIAAKADFQTRLHCARQTPGWRLMRLLRRMYAMLWKGEDGGLGGFFKWIFNRATAPAKNFDPFENALIHNADFERTPEDNPGDTSKPQQ